jgi:hypothetical protein
MPRAAPPQRLGRCRLEPTRWRRRTRRISLPDAPRRLSMPQTMWQICHGRRAARMTELHAIARQRTTRSQRVRHCNRVAAQRGVEPGKVLVCRGIQKDRPRQSRVSRESRCGRARRDRSVFRMVTRHAPISIGLPFGIDRAAQIGCAGATRMKMASCRRIGGGWNFADDARQLAAQGRVGDG